MHKLHMISEVKIMELNYLKEFVVLADIKNYLQAADYLYISQSSLSRHIKLLEEELGVQLFTRNTRNISLSKFGEIFLPYAIQMTQIQTTYQEALINYKRSIYGTLSIGSIPSMSQYSIIDLLFQFKQENPSFALNLIENDSIQLIDMIENHKLELAFIRSSDDICSKFQHVLFSEDSLAAVIPISHPFANRTNIHLSELSKETFLLLSSETFMYQLCVDECHKAGFEPTIGYTGRRSENIIAMVEKGAGIALLTQMPIIKPANSNIAIVEITPKISTSISLIYSKDKPLSKPAQQFINLMNRYLPL